MDTQKKYTFYLSKSLYDKLWEEHARTRKSMSLIIREALKEKLVKREKENEHE